MADDINPDRRAELMAGRDVLLPQLRGLHDLAAVSISADLRAAIEHQISVRQRRLDLILAELTAMDHVNSSHDAMLADGYPNLAVIALEPALYGELQGENADLDAAASIFRADQAATVAVNLGQAVPRAEPQPGD